MALESMKLSKASIDLLKYVVAYDGKKESAVSNGKEQEVDAPRKLKSDESALRRAFFKAVEAPLEVIKSKLVAVEKELGEFRKTRYAELKEEITDAGVVALEHDGLLGEKIKEANLYFVATQKELIEFTVDSKTKDFLKKYVASWGAEVGWQIGDDDQLAEIDAEFAK